MRKMRKSVAASYVLIAVGTAVCAAALNLFLLPAKMAPGGFSGIATILYYTFQIPVGLSVFALNIPVFLVSYKAVGRRFAIRSLFAIVLYSIFSELCPVMDVAGDRLLSAMYGGVLMGFGLGVVLAFGGSTGGSDMLAGVIHKKIPSMSVGVLVFIIDVVIIAASAIVFDLDAALFAVPSIFVTTKLIEYITEGMGRAKTFLIISDKSEEIKENIYRILERGVTEIYAAGGFSGREKKLLLCTVQRGAELVKLKNIVERTDESAFLIMWQAKEVNGQGFSSISDS